MARGGWGGGDPSGGGGGARGGTAGRGGAMGKAGATEGILKRVAELYTGGSEAGAGPGICERAADPHLGLEPIHRPRRRITVMMIGNHVSETPPAPPRPILHSTSPRVAPPRDPLHPPTPPCVPPHPPPPAGKLC